jgi:NhaP-type Na+/H+ or K+/H+ antiporter
MRGPWEQHLTMAVVLLAIAFTVYVLWSHMGGSALTAVAVLVALKPLFRKARRDQDEAEE